MKKQLLAGAVSLVVAAAPVFSVFATDIETTGDTTKNVTVGEVDEPVYSVDIEWGDLTFDWKYNPLKNKYDFLGRSTVCQTPVEGENLYYLASIGNLYSKYDCTDPVEDEISTEATYFTKAPTAYELKVWDESVDGKIKAQASFTPAEGYEWVEGVFSDLAFSNPMYIYADGTFAEYTETDGAFTNQMGSMPVAGEANHTLYDVLFHLEINPGMGNTTPITEGAKIGTVTIDIEPDLN